MTKFVESAGVIGVASSTRARPAYDYRANKIAPRTAKNARENNNSTAVRRLRKSTVRIDVAHSPWSADSLSHVVSRAVYKAGCSKSYRKDEAEKIRAALWDQKHACPGVVYVAPQPLADCAAMDDAVAAVASIETPQQRKNRLARERRAAAKAVA